MYVINNIISNILLWSIWIYLRCDYLSMLGLKLIHGNNVGPGKGPQYWCPVVCTSNRTSCDDVIKVKSVAITHSGRDKMAAISGPHFQIHITLKFVPMCPINNIAALVQIMAGRRSGDKPLSEPVMIKFTDSYMLHSASMRYILMTVSMTQSVL